MLQKWHQSTFCYRHNVTLHAVKYLEDRILGNSLIIRSRARMGQSYSRSWSLSVWNLSKLGATYEPWWCHQCVYSQCTCTRTEYQIRPSLQLPHTRIAALHNAQRILAPQDCLWYVNAEFVFLFCSHSFNIMRSSSNYTTIRSTSDYLLIFAKEPHDRSNEGSMTHGH